MAKPKPAPDPQGYYHRLVSRWERNYPSTSRLADAWAFYRECGWEDPDAQLAAPLRKMRRHPRRVLDFGCDTGVMLRFFEAHFPQTELFGIDINTRALQEGRRLFPHLNLVQFDGVSIPFRDGYFDLVFASAVLKHIRYEDRSALYAEFRRVAGWLFVAEVFAERQEVIEAHGFKFYHSDFRAELASEFREVHFTRVGGDFLGLYRLH